MNTTLTIKMDKKLRDDAKKTAKRMGIPLTTAVNAMVQKFVREGVIVLEAECPFPSHTPNTETRKAIEGGLKSQKGDKVFSTIEEFKRYMAAL